MAAGVEDQETGSRLAKTKLLQHETTSCGSSTSMAGYTTTSPDHVNAEACEPGRVSPTASVWPALKLLYSHTTNARTVRQPNRPTHIAGIQEALTTPTTLQCPQPVLPRGLVLDTQWSAADLRPV